MQSFMLLIDKTSIKGYSPFCSDSIEIKQRTFRLSKEIPYSNDEAHIPQLDIKNSAGMFTLQGKPDSRQKLCL